MHDPHNPTRDGVSTTSNSVVIDLLDNGRAYKVSVMTADNWKVTVDEQRLLLVERIGADAGEASSAYR